ncbi:MAG: hypothetical protein HYV07_00675 [Deltaproteobacteria bacterium]|nr:hypothetical protein [Deltaproteobacteria bacterium]
MQDGTILQKAFLVWSVLATTTSLAVGYFFGPEAAAIPIAVLLAVFAFGVLASAGGPRPRISASPSSTATASATATETSSAKFQGMAFYVMAAIVVRLIVGIFLNLTELATSLAPDSIGYYWYGRAIAGAWKYGRVDPAAMAGYQPLSFYQNLNGVAAYFVGEATPLVLSGLNAFVGTFAAWLVSRLALEMYGPIAARRAFMLTAFFPSMILWTSLNLRESWAFVAVMGSVLSLYRLRARFSAKDLFYFALCMGFLPFIRTYMLALVAAGVIASFLVVSVRQLPYAIVTLIVVALMLRSASSAFDLDTKLDPYRQLEKMQSMKEGLSSGSSGYHEDVDISSPGAALLYLPLGSIYFLFSPFPWTVEKPRQALASLEATIWFFFFLGACREILRSIRTRFSHVVLPLMVTLVVTAAYSLVEGNEGTAYRHRSMVLIFYFVFAAGDYAHRRTSARSFSGDPRLLSST